MLERVLAWVINNYLGEYFDNVNIDQLSIAYGEGEVELEGLPLKTESFKSIGLPFEIKSGYIGKIRLKGFYRLRSEPWSITIDELYLVLGPLNTFEYNEEKEKQSSENVKFGLLESLENQWKLHKSQQSSYYASSYSAWISYVTSLITTVMENLQLNIKSVHVRYEDNLSNTSVAGGIVINSLSACSTDESWQPKFINSTDASNISRKVVLLEDFGIYWDSNVIYTSDVERSESVELMRKLMSYNIMSDGSHCEHDFLITPIKGTALVARNSTDEPLKSRNKPRITLNLELEDFSLSLNIKQYRQLLDCFDEFVRIDTLWKNRKWRPSSPLKVSPKLWWKYAIDANLENWRNQRNKENWNYVIERSRMITRYCKIYYEFLDAPESISGETKEFKEKIECEMEFEDLFILREIVCEWRKKENYQRTYESSTANTESWGLLNGWIPSWIYSNYTPEVYESALDLNQTGDESITSCIDEELIDAFSSAVNDTLTSKDAIFLQFNIIVKQASAIVLTDLNTVSRKSSKTTLNNIPSIMEPLLEFVMTRLEATLETSPRSNNCDVKIENLLMKEKSHNLSCIQSNQMNNGLAQKQDIITIKYSFNHNEARETIVVVFNYFDIVFNQETLVELIRFFKAPPRFKSRLKRERKEKGEVSRRRFSSVHDLHTIDVKITFKQLNFVLLRVCDTPNESEDRKLATATMNSANISANINRKDVVVEGFLNSLQIIDNTANHAGIRVLNIGEDRVQTNGKSREKHAISFTMRRSFADDMLDITSKMSSFYYKHSAKLLFELASCASEFKSYMSSLANTIKTAAAEVAKEIVSKSADLSVDGISRFTLIQDSERKRTDNSLRSKIRSYIKDLRIEIHVLSPLIILPSSPSALETFRQLFSTAPPHADDIGMPVHATDRLKFVSVGIEIKNGVLRFVDDLMNEKSDSPLIEINAPELSLWQKMRGDVIKGNAKAMFASEYYNSSKSGWEPLIEPWKFDLNYEIRTKMWNRDGIFQRLSREHQTRKFSFNFSSSDTFNFNLTSTVLDMYRKLKIIWTSEIQNKQPARRQTFVPFTLTNEISSQLSLSAVRRGTPQFERMQKFCNWVPSLLRVKTEAVPKMELQVIIEAHGVGLSIVNKLNEELIYVTFRTIILEYLYTVTKHSLNCSVRYFQIDNQLYEAVKPVIIYPCLVEANDPVALQPAICVSIQKQLVHNANVHFFPEVQVKVKDVVFNLEELELLKIYEFFGYPWEVEQDGVNEYDPNSHKSFVAESELANARIFLTLFELTLNQIRLSVFTSSRLPPELVHLKKKLGLTLLAFEDANVQLESFKREYALDTYQFLVDAVIKHYKLQLRNQAAKILISVDFLGNPLGLMNDVTDGINEFMNDGNIGGLVTNITHGLSNSTAKFMSSLSDSLDLATDLKHQEMRRRIKQDNSDRLRTGLKGLGVGIIGGMTSIVTQTYEGVSNQGLGGLMSGFGRGVLGTFTKPAIGMLDFASEAAIVVRDTSKKIAQHAPPPDRLRLPRLRFAYNNLMLPYNKLQAEGQQFFHKTDIEDKEEYEIFHFIEIILPDVACIITSERIRFVTWGQHLSSQSGALVLSIAFEDLLRCATESIELPNSLMGACLVLTVGTLILEASMTDLACLRFDAVPKKLHEMLQQK